MATKLPARALPSTTWMTYAEALTYTRCSYGSLRRAVAAGRLTAYRLTTGAGSHRVRFTQSDLDAFLTSTPIAPGGDR